VFYLIGLSRALIDEAPHRFRVRHTQAMRFLHFVVPLKLRIADRDKMPPAKSFPFKRHTGNLVTPRDTALFSLSPLLKSPLGPHNDFNTTLCRTIGQPSLRCQGVALVRFLAR